MILSVTGGRGDGGGVSQICFVTVGGGLKAESECFRLLQRGRRSLEKHQIELYVTV